MHEILSKYDRILSKKVDEEIQENKEFTLSLDDQSYDKVMELIAKFGKIKINEKAEEFNSDHESAEHIKIQKLRENVEFTNALIRGKDGMIQIKDVMITALNNKVAENTKMRNTLESLLKSKEDQIQSLQQMISLKDLGLLTLRREIENHSANALRKEAVLGVQIENGLKEIERLRALINSYALIHEQLNHKEAVIQTLQRKETEYKSRITMLQQEVHSKDEGWAEIEKWSLENERLRKQLDLTQKHGVSAHQKQKQKWSLENDKWRKEIAEKNLDLKDCMVQIANLQKGLKARDAIIREWESKGNGGRSPKKEKNMKPEMTADMTKGEKVKQRVQWKPFSGSGGGKDYVDAMCKSAAKFGKPKVDTKRVNGKNGEKMWRCRIEIAELKLVKEWKNKQKSTAVRCCYLKLAQSISENFLSAKC